MTRLIEDENGVLTIDPLPEPDALARFYAEKYFQGAAPQYPGGYSAEQIAYTHIKDRMLDHLLGAPRGGLRILDLGCGEGFTAAYFHQRGHTVYAADFSRAGFAAQNPATLEAIPFFQGDIVGEPVFPGETFDLIVVNNVLEHVIDLYGLLEALSARLALEGRLFAAVPNEFNPLQAAYLERTGRADRREAPWFCPPEHIRYFSPDTLARAVESRGFTLERMLGDFPIELFLQHEATDYYAGDFGPVAHAIRVRASNILARDIGAFVALCAAQIGVGAGRDMYGFFRKSA